MTANPSTISICSLATMILRIIRLDFAGNTRNIFFESIKKIISERLDCFKSIHMGKCEYKIVMESNLLNLHIFYLF